MDECNACDLPKEMFMLLGREDLAVEDPHARLSLKPSITTTK